MSIQFDVVEKMMLGCIIMGKHEAIVELNENDFETDKVVFLSIKALYEDDKDIDIISVSDRSKVDIAYISSMVDSVTTSEAWPTYLAQLKKNSAHKNILTLSKELIKIDTSNFDTASDLSNIAMSIVEQNLSSNENKKILSTEELMLELLDDIEIEHRNNSSNLFTGYKKLDAITGGLVAGDLIVIAARPGVGKTAFSLQLMLKLASKGKKCTYITREMLAKQILRRVVSNVAGVNGSKLRNCTMLQDKDWQDISRKTNEICNLSFEIIDNMKYIQEVKSYCKIQRGKGKLDVLFVDYIGLMKTMKKCDSRRLEFDDITATLKSIALDLQIPVVAMAQLNREVEKRKNSEPILSDLKESGGIEQDADIVIFLHKKIDEDEDATQIPDRQDIKVILAKQRNGATGAIWFDTYPHLFRYYEK